MSNLALPLAGLAFCCWAVYLGGLASFQNLVGINTAFRYDWFIMSYEIVMIIALAAVAAMGKLHKMKISFVGLFSVALVLFIYEVNNLMIAFYSDTLNPSNNTIRTITAGAIMTATVNAFLVIALGIEDDSMTGAPGVSIEKAAAV